MVTKAKPQTIKFQSRAMRIAREMLADCEWEKSKRLIPRLRIVEELPGGFAAYHPWTRTIWLKRLSFWRMAWHLLHEVIHHVIDVLGGRKAVHNTYDRIWNRWIVRKK